MTESPVRTSTLRRVRGHLRRTIYGVPHPVRSHLRKTVDAPEPINVKIYRRGEDPLLDREMDSHPYYTPENLRAFFFRQRPRTIYLSNQRGQAAKDVERSLSHESVHIALNDIGEFDSDFIDSLRPKTMNSKAPARKHLTVSGLYPRKRKRV